MERIYVAQAQLDAYNAQDLDAFCGFYTEDVIVSDLGGPVTLEGRAAYRARYERLFAEHPQNKVVLLARVAVGEVVIDHERVYRSPEAAPFDVAAIYRFRGDRICRVDFVKG